MSNECELTETRGTVKDATTECNSSTNRPTRPVIMVSLKDFDKMPLAILYKVVMERYGETGKFDALKLIKELSEGTVDINYSNVVRWLMINCKLCQTDEMVEYYKSLSPSTRDVSWLITSCDFCRTDEMIRYYKSLKPDTEDVSWLIADCSFCQTDDMVEYYKSLSHDTEDVSWLIADCSFCQTDDMVKYYKSLKPNAEDVRWLIDNCKFCQTEKIMTVLKS